MFNLFGKKKASVPFDFSLIGTDMHSHLLPGIDDGATDLENSLELIKGLHQLGYTKFITTPHIMAGMYHNTPEIINDRLGLVRQALEQHNIPVTIHGAAEYFLDEHVEELLQKKEPLLTISDNLVLTEFSMAQPPMNIKDILFEMQMQGYQPIIAHPERYTYLIQNKGFYNELKDIGCYFQLNILSLSGGYGKVVSELAQYLLKNNFYNLLGTDLHHVRHLDALHNPALTDQLNKVLSDNQLLNRSL
jgi:protein-tyrosine phosphatase